MQLRFTNPISFKIAGSGFNQSISAVLTGITLAGAFSTLIFNSKIANDQTSKAFEAIKDILKKSLLYEGIKEVVVQLKNWGSAIIATKDDFKIWLNNYLNPSGFKSGVVNLYEKLIAWVNIVYEWFRDRFLEFVNNIPKMVENWKKLRLSLFKWGTFLGGGGGSALWAMFGSFDNLGKLADLMGNEEFAGAVEKFGELVEKNSDAFGKMSEEDMKEIFQKMMDDPKEAKDIAQQLLDEQKEKNQGEEGEPKELEQERIKEAYSNQKAGKPKDSSQALSDLIGAGLKGILQNKNSFRGAFETSKEALKKHIEHLKNESKGSTKIAKVKEEFLKEIKESEDSVINTFARLSEQAYNDAHRFYGKVEPEKIKEIFENLMEKEFTVEASSEDEADAKAIKGLLEGQKLSVSKK